MKQFNWEEFKDKNNKIAVHCKTEEEANDFCKKMHEHGMIWNNGNSFLERTNFNVWNSKTCYYSNGTCSKVKYAKKYEYKILEWSDYMKKEFTKADLKDGMVVEQGNKVRFLVVGDRILTFDGYNLLSSYDDNLTNLNFGDAYGIEKVFRVRDNCVNTLQELFDNENLELIWERTKPKKMTAEEMRKKLEELTGENIEVEPSIEEKFGVINAHCCETSCTDCILFNRALPLCSFKEHIKNKDNIEECYKKIIEQKK